MESYYMENMRKNNSPNNFPHAEAISPVSRTPSPEQQCQQVQEEAKRKQLNGSKLIVHNFFHYTTINGLQRLASATTIIGRLFWILVMFGALAMFSRDLYELINQYYDRPTTIVSKINYFKTMNFPAVTICNVNPIRNGFADIQQLSASLKKRDDDHCFKEDMRNDSCEEDVDEYADFDDEIYYLLANTNEAILKRAGHQQQDLIVSCRFNGIRCRKKKYWTQFWNPQYGNCYTFNGQLSGSNSSIPLFRTTKSGSSNGLQLVLNIEVDRYIPEITEDSGVKLVISGPRQMPFPLYESVSLAPGLKTDVSVKRVQITRADRYSNGTCRASLVLDKDNPYLKKYNISYSVQACLHECYSRSQLEKCGCAEYAYFTATPTGNVCDESNKKTEDCLTEWSQNSGSCDQTCTQPCKETVYEPTISFTQWPSPVSVASVLDTLGKNFSDYDNKIEHVWSNFLSVNIFFQRFRETTIEESLTYQTANLLADIGGQIGLWAGLSVISMCELIELTALLVRKCFNGRMAN